MFEIVFQNKFKKDYKLAIKRGLDMKILENVLLVLRDEGKLPAKYKPHLLKGNYQNYWECHLQAVPIIIGRLLIWKQDEQIKLISIARTGSHSDLFK